MKSLNYSVKKMGGSVYVALFLVSSALLGGCMAALPVYTALNVAGMAWGATKLVQTHTGKYEVSFRDNELNKQTHQEVQNIRKLGVWPSLAGTSTEVGGTALIAQELQNKSKLQIVTPHKIDVALKSKKLDNVSENMTEQEKSKLFVKIGKSLNVNAIMFVRDEGKSRDAKTFSFKYSEYRRHFSVNVYSMTAGKVIYATEVRLIKKGGEVSQTNEGEFQKMVATQLADHFLQAM